MKDGQVCMGRSEGRLAPELRVINHCELVLVIWCRRQVISRVRDDRDAGGQ